jgi:RISC-loading complex subunit TARBP2
MQEIIVADQLKDFSIYDMSNINATGLIACREGNRRRHHKKNITNTIQGAAKLESLTIEEAIKNEIEYMPMKTPISILQELLSRRGITPNYELVQIEGAVHEPTFRYRVSFNDKDAMGVGRSKKEAKHAAAKSLIDKLTGLNLSDAHYQQATTLPTSQTIPTTNGNPVAANVSGNNSFDEKNTMGNPIGVLQELCMSKHWPPPTYETEMEVGLPHERQFTIACIVLRHREVGTGKSKKIAKRQAAYKMWQKLNEHPLEQTEIIQSLDDEGNDEIRVANILSRYADLKDAHIATLTNQHSYKVSQFHKTLKNTFGKTLAKLQNMCLNEKDVNYVQFLHEIAVEHQFEVTYVDIEEKTYSGRCQCLVQLSTLPVAVCQGSGKTSKEAQTNAAKNALEYLKIMTKK